MLSSSSNGIVERTLLPRGLLWFRPQSPGWHRQITDSLRRKIFCFGGDAQDFCPYLVATLLWSYWRMPSTASPRCRRSIQGCICAHRHRLLGLYHHTKHLHPNRRSSPLTIWIGISYSLCALLYSNRSSFLRIHFGWLWILGSHFSSQAPAQSIGLQGFVSSTCKNHLAQTKKNGFNKIHSNDHNRYITYYLQQLIP